MGEPAGLWEMFYLVLGGGFTGVSACLKIFQSYQAIHLTFVHFMEVIPQFKKKRQKQTNNE